MAMKEYTTLPKSQELEIYTQDTTFLVGGLTSQQRYSGWSKKIKDRTTRL